MDKSRQSRKISVELLRIVAMLMIVMCHAAVRLGFTLNGHTDIAGPLQPHGWSGAAYLFVGQFGQIGVMLFFIITGYFLCKKAFSLPRITKLWAQVLLYSIVITIICASIFLFSGGGMWPSAVGTLFSGQAIVLTVSNIIAPIISHQYWFITAYVVLLFLSPILNELIKRFGKRSLEKALLFFALLSTIMVVEPAFNYNNNIFRAIFGYLIGAYIGMYLNIASKKFRPRNLVIVIAACGLAMITFSRVALSNSYITHAFGWNTQAQNGLQLAIAIVAAAMFVLFIRGGRVDKWLAPKKRLGRAITLLSSATFGMYLIHENMFLRYDIWPAISNLMPFANNAPTLEKFALLLLIALGVFAVCVVAAMLLDHLFAPAKKFLVAKITPRLAKLKIFAE